MKSAIKLLLIALIMLTLSLQAAAQNIDELIGEIKYSQEGYYVLTAGGKQYLLANVPREPGQVKEGKYYVMGFATIDVQDQTFNGLIPFQITKMDYKGPLQGAQENGADAEAGPMEVTGYIFYYTKSAVPTYVLSVLDQNKQPVYYPIANIPAQPNQIAQGLYKVTAIKNPSLQNPSGIGIPIQITACEPADNQTAGQQQDQNQAKIYEGRLMFMPLVQGSDTGFYVLTTQDNQQFMLSNLPQKKDKKYQPGLYKVQGIIEPNAENPYNIGIPMKVTAINFVMPLPGMENTDMNDPASLFYNNDEQEEYDNLYDSGGFDIDGGGGTEDPGGSMW